MNPPKFQVGQRVVCIKDHWPLLHSDGNPMPAAMPVLYQVYTVAGMLTGSGAANSKLWYIVLDEIGAGNCFFEGHFAPAEEISDEALAELLSESFSPVTT